MFQIQFGGSWERDLGAPGGGPGAIDYARVRDAIDLVLGGENLAARARPDSVLCIAADLGRAALALARGETDKAVVPFREEAWEIVAVRSGEGILLTFYRGGPVPEIVAKDAPVPLAEFVGAVREGLLSVLARLERVADPRDPFAAGLRGTAEALAAWTEEPHEGASARARPEARGTRRNVESRGWDEPMVHEVPSVTTRVPLAFAFELEVATPATPGRVGSGARADLHALLHPGAVAVSANGRRHVFATGFPYLHVERLQQALRQTLAAWEDGRPLHIRLRSGALLFSVRLDSREEVAFTVENVERHEVVGAEAIAVGAFAEAVLAIAREMRRVLCEIDRAQARNLRLADFFAETRTLCDQVRELSRDDSITNVDPSPYAASLPRPGRPAGSPAAARPAVPAGIDVGAARRLRFEPRWKLMAEGIDLGSTYLCGERLVVTNARGLTAVDRRTGEVLWERTVERAVCAAAGRDGIVRARPNGEVELLCLEDGEPLWRAQLRPRAGGPPFVVAAGGSGIPRIAVVAEGEKRLVGIDLRTGERRWRYTARRLGGFRARRAGRLLYVTSGESSLTALDLVEGTVVWRLAARARFATTPVFHERMLLAPSGERPRAGRLYAVDALSGELRWQRDLPGPLCAPPGGAGPVVLAIGRTLTSPILTALSLETGETLWERKSAPLAEGFAAMAIDGAFVFNTALGEVLCVDAQSGREIYRTRLAAPRVRNVPKRLEPVLRGGALFVPSAGVYVVRAATGEVIARVEACPLVPDYLRVDEECSLYVGEDAGYLASYGVGARLTLVK